MYFYKFHIGDFAMWTAGFDSESVGIFIKLLNRYMLTENPIKTDWVSLGFPISEQEKAKAILSSCWEETADGWVFSPVREIVEHYQSSKAKNRENGKKGGRPRKANSNPNETQTKPSGFSEETQTEPNTKPNSVNSINSVNSVKKDIDTHPSPSAQDASVSTPPAKKAKRTSVCKPADVPENLWCDWIALRKQKRLPLTAQALALMQSEAAKAGKTLADVLQICLQNSWAGFKASWLTNATNTQQQPERPFYTPAHDWEEERKEHVAHAEALMRFALGGKA